MTNLTSEIFYMDNARAEERDQIVSHYVDTPHLWQLFVAKHQIVFGSRGSGKTALMKMVSFPFISIFGHEKAEKVTQDFRFVGVHVSTDVRFVGSLQNKIWRTEEQAERYFVWKFNMACLKALLSTLDSVFQHVFPDELNRYSVENTFCNQVCKFFFDGVVNIRMNELISKLDSFEDQRSMELYLEFQKQEPSTPIGPMGVEIGDPIRIVDRLLKSLSSKFAEVTWLICIDEAEFLPDQQIAILNSFMRSYTKNIFFKIATLPYHYNLKTNLTVPLREEDDVHFLYLDEMSYDVNDKAQQHWEEFASKLFIARQSNLQSNLGSVKLGQILGDSGHLARIGEKVSVENELAKIESHCDEATVQRAKKLIKTKKKRTEFSDQIWRKVAGAIALREDFSFAKGRRTMEFYSGVSVMVRCTDGVPRKLINLFRKLVTEIEHTQNIRRQRARLARNTATARSVGLKKISALKQTTIAKDIADQRFERIKTIPKYGPEVYKLAQLLGRYLHHKLHEEPISTDIINCFRFDERTTTKLTELVRSGIASSDFFTVASINRPNKLPEREGIFRLSYSLCPKFDLLPRRGKDRLVQKVVAASQRRDVGGEEQLSLRLGQNEPED